MKIAVATVTLLLLLSMGVMGEGNHFGPKLDFELSPQINIENSSMNVSLNLLSSINILPCYYKIDNISVYNPGLMFFAHFYKGWKLKKSGENVSYYNTFTFGNRRVGYTMNDIQSIGNGSALIIISEINKNITLNARNKIILQPNDTYNITYELRLKLNDTINGFVVINQGFFWKNINKIIFSNYSQNKTNIFSYHFRFQHLVDLNYFLNNNSTVNGRNEHIGIKWKNFLNYDRFSYIIPVRGQNYINITYDPLLNLPNFTISSHTVLLIGNDIFALIISNAISLGYGLIAGVMVITVSYAFYRKKRY
ncbi:hypothetical protein [Caldiplasma sukawensis]